MRLRPRALCGLAFVATLICGCLVPVTLWADNTAVPTTTGGGAGSTPLDACAAASDRHDDAAVITACSKALDAGQLSDNAAAGALTSRGLAFSHKGDYPKAIDDFDRALALKPQTPELLAMRGFAFLLNRDFQRAVDDASAAIGRAPDRGDYYGLRADAYAQSGDARAISDYAEAVRLGTLPNVDAAERPLREGVAAYLKGDPATAAEAFSQVRNAAPDDLRVVLWQNLALQADHRNAAMTLDTAAAAIDLEKWPGPLIRYYQGQLPETELETAAIDPDPSVANRHICDVTFYVAARALIDGQVGVAKEGFSRAPLFCAKGSLEFDAAKAELVLAANLAGNTTSTDLFACQDADKAGDNDGVIAACGRALGHPDIVDAWRFGALTRRAKAYNRAGEPLKAVADLDAAVTLRPDASEIYRTRGLYRLDLGETEGGLADLAYALTLEPQSIEIRVTRGWAFQALGRTDRALADFTAAIALQPDNPRLLLGRGVVAYLAGADQPAMSDFTAAIRAAPQGAPYAVLWLTLAGLRSRQDPGQDLADGAAVLDPAAWPAPVLAFVQGKMTEQDLASAAADPDPATAVRQDCEAAFYSGEAARIVGDAAAARTRLQHARDVCSPDNLEYRAAVAELAKLN